MRIVTSLSHLARGPGYVWASLKYGRCLLVNASDSQGAEARTESKLAFTSLSRTHLLLFVNQGR